VDLLASRDGTMTTRMGVRVLVPYVYTVDAARVLRRNDGAPGQWSDYGAGGTAALAEVGLVPGQISLYRLLADRGSIWLWAGPTSRWIRVGGAAEMMTGGVDRLLATTANNPPTT
jgi:hypothetical protein